MTYFDSAEDLTISKQRALQELAKHGVVASDIDVFFSALLQIVGGDKLIIPFC